MVLSLVFLGSAGGEGALVEGVIKSFDGKVSWVLRLYIKLVKGLVKVSFLEFVEPGALGKGALSF